MEFYGVDEVDCVVEGGEEGGVGAERGAGAVPAEIVGGAVEEERGSGNGAVVDVFVGEVEDAFGEGPV